MADDLDKFEVDASVQERKTATEMRTVLADVYTFVRSAELNKTIASFTFDHYVDEAKRKIKEDRILRSASNPSQGVGRRPSQLAALTKLEQDFNNMISKIREAAQAKDSEPGGST